MVDIQELASRGVSSGAFKQLFTAPPDKRDRKFNKLLATLQQRIHSGRETNLTEYKVYWAIDLAHETPFAQTTPTLVQNLLSKNLSHEATYRELESWGLADRDLFLSVKLPDGQIGKVINPPVFFQILIPIVRSYHAAKLALIYNERDTSPLFKYNPSRNVDSDRVACEIVTGIVDKTTQWYGHTEYLKQAIGQMLKYGLCLSFPKEEWHYEKQIINGRTVTQKEGLRYNLPHPTRMGFDLHHPLPTINTDTGCEYAYHWDVLRYGDVMDNRMFWNRSAISHGTNWMDRPVCRNYFNEVFPCRMKFPSYGGAMMTREDKAAYYGTADRDNAVFLTEFFWKLIPKNYGLGDYKYPVWHRFTVASDNTVLWAAPCAYNPVWAMAYDYDAQAGIPSSFSLEVIPWQDHLGNILSQMILTAKQNLDNTIFYDKLLVNQKDIDRMENLGERRYRSRNFIGYDSTKLSRSGLNIKEAFFSPQLQYRSISELQTMLSTALGIMERSLGITAQETGAAAQHYQSKEEVVTVRGSADNRNRSIASSVDAGIDAWKLQLYEGNMAYRDAAVEAHVSEEIPNLEAILAKIGFSVIGTGPYKKLVGGKKGALAYLDFARTNVDPSQKSDPQSAQAIIQGITIMASNPEFVQKVGVGRVIKLIEQAVKFNGGPDDFDLTSPTAGDKAGPEMMSQIAPLLQQLQQTIMQTITEQVAKPAAQAVGKAEQEIQAIQAQVKTLTGVFQANGIDAAKLQMAQQELAHKLQIEQAGFQAGQQRLNEQHQLDMQITAAKAGLEAKTKTEKAQLDATIKTEMASVDAVVKVKQAGAAK